MTRSLTLSILVGTAVLTACSEQTPSAPSDPVAPSFALQASPQAGDLIPDQYIVVFKNDVSDVPGQARRLAALHGATVQRTYGAALKGFAGSMSAAAAGRLRADPTVAYVEQDQVMRADATQTGATWGLDRIDQLALPLSNSYSYNATGAGVTAYIIDTGIRFDHSEFGVRASSGFDAVDGGSADDCNGHGTHVSGTVGGSTYGVAKAVSLIAVRVLNCQGSGSTAGVIDGINWVSSNHADGAPAVANMSLGGGFSQALNDAVTNSIKDGVTYGVAAGNSSANACDYSPSSTPAAITVGATTSSDAQASYSNFGTCVDLYAPGSSITSAWYTSTTATNTISGTSMATPHVVGVAALVLSSGNQTPAAVRDAIVANATSGVITGIGAGSPNLLLYSLFAGGGGPPPPPPAEMHVGALTGTSSWKPNHKQWLGRVTITVLSGTSAVSGAVVTGNWSNGTSGATSCTTGASGTCTVQTGSVGSATASVQWNVGSVSASGKAYDASLNSPNPITVQRPL